MLSLFPFSTIQPQHSIYDMKKINGQFLSDISSLQQVQFLIVSFVVSNLEKILCWCEEHLIDLDITGQFIHFLDSKITKSCFNLFHTKIENRSFYIHIEYIIWETQNRCFMPPSVAAWVLLTGLHTFVKIHIGGYFSSIWLVESYILLRKWVRLRVEDIMHESLELLRGHRQ